MCRRTAPAAIAPQDEVKPKSEGSRAGGDGRRNCAICSAKLWSSWWGICHRCYPVRNVAKYGSARRPLGIPSADWWPDGATKDDPKPQAWRDEWASLGLIQPHPDSVPTAAAQRPGELPLAGEVFLPRTGGAQRDQGDAGPEKQASLSTMDKVSKLKELGARRQGETFVAYSRRYPQVLD